MKIYLYLFFIYKMEEIIPDFPILTHKMPQEATKVLRINMQSFNASNEPQIAMPAKMTSRIFSVYVCIFIGDI